MQIISKWALVESGPNQATIGTKALELKIKNMGANAFLLYRQQAGILENCFRH